MVRARVEEEPVKTAPVVTPATWVPGTQFSEYEIESLLATGGMAEVWRAKMKGVESKGKESKDSKPASTKAPTSGD